MNVPPTTPPYEYEHHTRQVRLPGLKRLFDSIDHSVTRSDAVPSQLLSPPDLLHDSEEDDEDTLSTPSLSLSPKQDFLSKDHDLIKRNKSYYQSNHHRTKSVPHKSPSLNQQLIDKSVVFQLDVHESTSQTQQKEYIANQRYQDRNWNCTSQIICGQSLLSNLRARVAHARSSQRKIKETRLSRPKRARTASIIEIPRRNYHRYYSSLPDINGCYADHDPVRLNGNKRHHEDSTAAANVPESYPWSDHQPFQQEDSVHHQQQQTKSNQSDDQDQHQRKRLKKLPNTPRCGSSTQSSSSGRPSRVKGPCQACQEPSDGCMRKAFNWPFASNQLFSDKGKPFVYLCNKCGLR